MINLLPPAEKQKLLLEKKEKLTKILGIIFLFFLVSLVLVLLSIKFYLLAEADYQKNALQQIEKEKQIPDSADLNGIVQKYNGILAQVDSFYKEEIYFNQVLKIITDIPSPKGLYLASFSLNRDKSGIIQASVSGISDTRDNLLIFKKNIEQDKQIKNPYFPPENWISPKNVKFSLTFQIDEKQ